jgi:nickel-dependent lactate racemase
MSEIILKSACKEGISDAELKDVLGISLREVTGRLKKVLLVPPDITRANSCAGKITAFYYSMLKKNCRVHVMPALGTHEPMTAEERHEMFGTCIPDDCFMDHNWRADVVKIGEVPREFVAKVSKGFFDRPVDVEVNRAIMDSSYDLVISIGQVVPHEVAGMANHNKNIFVGCGGCSMISHSHMLGAVYGMERIMGRDINPVRMVFDYAEDNFLKDVPLMYVMTVTTADMNGTHLHGIFIGRGKKLFTEAASLSREKNLTFVDKPFKKAVVYLDEKEFKSTWLGNKAIYRTRMAMADGGELIIIAPGVRRFGEDSVNDEIIRKYGYIGRDRILKLLRGEKELQNNLSVAAHLIHGSSEGRFSITYAPGKLRGHEVEGVNLSYMPIEEALKKYRPGRLKDGYNRVGNKETIYYISNPALGLWTDKSRFPV